MMHEEIRLHLAEDVSLRLLQSGNAPLVLSFLHAQFKTPATEHAPRWTPSAFIVPGTPLSEADVRRCRT